MSQPLIPSTWSRYPLKYRTATTGGYKAPSIRGLPATTFNPSTGLGAVDLAPARFGRNYAFVLAAQGTAPPPPP